MSRQGIRNKKNEKAKYYGYRKDGAMANELLGGFDTTQGRRNRGSVRSAVSIRPARNRKAGAQ
jgi:hypothetical protein